MKKHENYKELIWMLAKTDFKLRYHGSFLGYLWALLKPLITFAILNFVFSSVFNPRGTGADTYSLQLIVALMMFYFFSEGTGAGLSSLLNKAQLVTKIYVPRWTIILASTVNATMIFLMNLVVIVGLFIYKGFMPSIASILLFLLFSIFIYIIVLSFSLVTAPLYVKFRDLAMIWEVLLMVLLYASPIIYPLETLPVQYHKIILLNPIAFIVHFTKEAMIHNHFADWHQYSIFIAIVFGFLAFSIWAYQKLIVKVAEEI